MTQLMTSEALNQGEMFTFGDCRFSEVDVLTIGRCELSSCGNYYEPPISFNELSKAARSQENHESALRFKANVMTVVFKKNEKLLHREFKNMMTDFFVFGNAYLEPVTNKLKNKVIAYQHVPCTIVRVGKKVGEYYVRQDNPDGSSEYILNKKIIHFKEYDWDQTIYGIPSYISALPSISLNKEATIFRIRFYKNGSHAGFILLLTGHIEKQVLDKLRNDLQGVKDQNSFKNIMLHLPKGVADSVKLIPIAEVGAKDEFINIKNTTSEDIITIHRVNPALMSMFAKNAGGFGDISKIAKIYYQNEMIPMINQLTDLNVLLNDTVFEFDEYTLE